MRPDPGVLFSAVPDREGIAKALCPKGYRVIWTCSRIALHTHTQNHKREGREGEVHREQYIETPWNPWPVGGLLYSGTGRKQAVFPRTVPCFLIKLHWKSKDARLALPWPVGKQPATDSDQRNAIGAGRAPWRIRSDICQYHALSLKIIHCRSLSAPPYPRRQAFHAGVEWCLPSRPPTRMTLL